jgi:hypothetical protein
MRLFRDQGILTQICGNDFLVLRTTTPLNASQTSLDAFVEGLDRVLELVHLRAVPAGRAGTGRAGGAHVKQKSDKILTVL